MFMAYVYPFILFEFLNNNYDNLINLLSIWIVEIIFAIEDGAYVCSGCNMGTIDRPVCLKS